MPTKAVGNASLLPTLPKYIVSRGTGGVFEIICSGSENEIMAKVFLERASYEYGTLKSQVFSMMEACGVSVAGGQRVLLKPNLLAPASPEKAILTHPMVVKAVVEYVLENGGVVQLSDSPAMGGFEKVLRESGIKDALDGLPVVFKELRDSVTVEVGPPFNRLELAADALEADVLINLPKLKTHGQMLLTLGVKNLFGCVVGLRKPQWHLRTGVDREMFAALLVTIYRRLMPSITILDGILAMEGNGPGRGGKPRELGVLMASTDAPAIDVTVCEMLGVPPDSLFTNAAARRAGIAPDRIDVQGEMVRVRDFKLPKISPLVFGPKLTHKFMRKFLIQRPQADESLCKGCGDCRKYCPAGAITQTARTIEFDYDRCIRCYCCIEVCPHGALGAVEPTPGRLFNRIIRR